MLLLVNFSWLERAPGARGRRRRAARTQRELIQPKKVIIYRSPLVRLYHMNTPHRPREADFRSTAPFSRTGMLLLNGLGCSVSLINTGHIIQKSDVELTVTVIGTARHRWWSWSQFSRSAHCERPAEDASSCVMARAGLVAPRTSMTCRLLRTSSRLSVLFLE